MVACSNSINSNITGSKQNVWLTNSNNSNINITGSNQENVWLTNSNSSISISNRTCSNQNNVIIIIDSFYIALLSALEQTHCTCM